MARMDGERVERREQKLKYLKWLDAFLDDRYPQKDSHSKIITRNKTLIIQRQSTGNVAAGKIPETESEKEKIKRIENLNRSIKDYTLEIEVWWGKSSYECWRQKMKETDTPSLLKDLLIFFQKLSGWNRNGRLKFAVKAMGKDTR